MPICSVYSTHAQTITSSAFFYFFYEVKQWSMLALSSGCTTLRLVGSRGWRSGAAKKNNNEIHCVCPFKMWQSETETPLIRAMFPMCLHTAVQRLLFRDWRRTAGEDDNFRTWLHILRLDLFQQQLQFYRCVNTHNITQCTIYFSNKKGHFN